MNRTMKPNSIRLMSQCPPLSLLSMALFLFAAGSASAGPKELGAFVKGEWKPTERPEVSIVLFRWGASGVQTLTTSEDRMLGQIASRGQRNVEIVMRTPPHKQSSTSSRAPLPPSYEVRLRCGVQICGEGLVVPCGQCPFSRKYNGDSLVSRGAYTSNICCFDATFERVRGVDNLHIVDVIADGESVPYMVKFTVKPTIMRSGTKVPIPVGSRLHGASVTFQKLDDEPEGETEKRNPRAQELSSDGFSDNPGQSSQRPDPGSVSTAEQGGVYEESAPFRVFQNNKSISAKFCFRVPEGGGKADLTVEGPGFRLKGASDLRTFAEGLKSSYEAWQGVRRSKKSSEGSWNISLVLSGVKFPRMEVPRDSRQPVVEWKEAPVRAVIVQQQISSDSREASVRLETATSGTGDWQELFTIYGGALPSVLQCLSPPPSIRAMLR